MTAHAESTVRAVVAHGARETRGKGRRQLLRVCCFPPSTEQQKPLWDEGDDEKAGGGGGSRLQPATCRRRGWARGRVGTTATFQRRAREAGRRGTRGKQRLSEQRAGSALSAPATLRKMDKFSQYIKYM